MKLVVLAAIVGVALSQRVTLIDGIQYRRVTIGTQTQTERTIYRPYVRRPLVAVGGVAPALAAANADANEYLFVEGENLALSPVRIILASPNVACGAAVVGSPFCTTLGTARVPSCELTIDSVSANKINFLIPASTITQGNTRYADKLCILGDQGSAAWVDTNIVYQVYIPCLADAVSGSTDASATQTLTTNADGSITFPDNCQFISALNLDQNVQSQIYRTSVRENSVTVGTSIQSDWDLVDRRSRTRCCGWRNANVLDAANNNAQMTRRPGMCYDPNVQSCCSGVEDNRKQTGSALQINVAGTGKLVNKFTEKCCYGGVYNILSDPVAQPLATRRGGLSPFIRNWDDTCPCLNNPATDYCNSYEACCQPSKFPEFNSFKAATYGSCYDPKRVGCCDTGATFNSGTQQCCKVTGVQSLDVPCPCQNDAHCDLNQKCCRHYNPTQSEVAIESASCNIYVNYLSGLTGATATNAFGQDANANINLNHRCLGQCLDTRFMICCNGNPCVGAYERCCNDTCCNKLTSSCVMGKKSPVGGRYNEQNVGVYYEICTTVEALWPIRAVVAFFLPIMLLFVTLTGLAFTLYFAKKQNSLNPLSVYEKAIATLGFLVIFFAWPLYFSPLYKYGVIAVWVSFFTILSATCGVKRLLPIALLLQVVLLIYIFDPFGGNEILNLAYTRQTSPLFQNVADSGLYLSIMGLWRPGVGIPGSRCATFYANWFIRDPMVEDQARLDFAGAKTTFGYCSREFIATLMIVEILMGMWVIIMTVVTLVTFIKNVLISQVVKQNPFHM